VTTILDADRLSRFWLASVSFRAFCFCPMFPRLFSGSLTPVACFSHHQLSVSFTPAAFSVRGPETVNSVRPTVPLRLRQLYELLVLHVFFWFFVLLLFRMAVGCLLECALPSCGGCGVACCWSFLYRSPSPGLRLTVLFFGRFPRAPC